MAKSYGAYDRFIWRELKRKLMYSGWTTLDSGAVEAQENSEIPMETD